MGIAQQTGGIASLIIFIGMIHTGMNLHGGNPTIFGPPAQPHPILGALLVAGAFIAAPIVYRIFVPARRGF